MVAQGCRSGIYSGNFTLCWKLDIYLTSESGDSKRIFVNASSGVIERIITISIRCDAGTGNTTWYGNQGISIYEQSNLQQ
jgi:hypothetical protein